MKVAGAGAMLGQLRELAAELALEDEIAFLGHRSDMPELLRSSSLLLATATREHFGLTVLEAMSAGLPVVAVGSAGHLESVGRVEDPALFDASDVAEAARLLRVLAQDPAERNRYGARLNAVARGVFSIKAQQAATDDVYRSVLK
jgi:glycosyltransferase involved in cell wall biosynthesis